MTELAAINWGDAAFTVIIGVLVVAVAYALIRLLIKWARG